MKMLLPILLSGALFSLPLPADAAKSDCLGCHQKKTPGVIAPWRSSAHADDVGCADCHGSSFEANHPKEGSRPPVGRARCAPCPSSRS